MSRPLRIQYPGAFYHVMNRGLNRNPIFLEKERDRFLFKKTIGEAVERWKIRIHAFSLMNNHYHLLVETPFGNISRALRHIDGVYTQRFNWFHRRDGPLLRGRFKSILVEKESYFLELVRYIHMNGAKAKLFPSPELDFYCSHYDYLHPQQAAAWLEQSLVLSHFENSVFPAREALHRFVLEGVPDELEKCLSRQKWPAILGVKSFVDSIRERYLKSQKKNSELPQKNLLLQTKALNPDLILKIVFETYSKGDKCIQIEAINSNREMRWATMYFLRQYAFLNYKQIGILLGGLSYKAVQKYLLRNNFRTAPAVCRLEQKLSMSHVAT